MQTELNNRNYLVEKANGKTDDLLAQLEKVKTDFAEEKEVYLKISVLTVPTSQCHFFFLC